MSYHLITTYCAEDAANGLPAYLTAAIDCSPAGFVLMQLQEIGYVEQQIVWSCEINEHEYRAMSKIWGSKIWAEEE